MKPLSVALLLLAVLAAPAASAAVSLQRGIYLVPADDDIAPAHGRPFNLAGKTITFTRTGSSSFRSDTTALQFDDDRGAQLTLSSATRSTTYTIHAFDFPFFGTSTHTLYVSQLFAIYLAPPPALPGGSFVQYTDADLMAQTTPLIAPLLTTPRGEGSFLAPKVYAKESSDRVQFTWYEPTRGVDVQAVLFKSGNIRFSYRGIGQTHGGAVVISSGNESWRQVSTSVSATDPPNDFATAAPEATAGMTDITRVEIGRVAHSNVLQMTITTRQAIDLAQMPQGLSVDLLSGSLTSTEFLASIPFLPGQALHGRIEGNHIVLLLDAKRFETAFSGDLTLILARNTGNDTVTFHASFDAPSRSIRTDFANTPSVSSFSGPIQDAFVLSPLDPMKVWTRLRDDLQLDPTTIDGVAVYEGMDSLNDFASPATYPGNPGADGISFDPTMSSQLPRAPAVMGLGRILQTSNATDFYTSFLLLHEFGHHWLFYVGHTNAPGKPQDAITLRGGHPSPTLNSPAAFNYATSYDNDPMGAGVFFDNHDGTFTTQPEDADVGYSWLSLYLMGLASPDEVPPFFYLTDLPMDVSEMPPDFTFSATRNDLTIANVIERMGPRTPAYPEAPHVFRVLFVLVYEPSQPPSEDDIGAMQHYADLLRVRFQHATGSRATILTDFEPEHPRHRAVRK
ncbi:MAG: hypothetical protein JO197_11095 [Acidobacteria bacterium]|nr:hypothetical protein [Acidobacteriota bacterium]MBV9475707.1 hypothetical protein [Acidobacteriota bacterium]